MTVTTTVWPMPHNTTIINEINRVMALYAISSAHAISTHLYIAMFMPIYLRKNVHEQQKGLNNGKTNSKDHEPMLEVLQGLLRPLHLQRTCSFCLLPLLSHASISCLRLSSSTIQPLVYFTIHPSLSSIHFYHSQICCSYHSPICRYCYHIGEEICAATTVTT
jgi:hypothetical protein